MAAKLFRNFFFLNYFEISQILLTDIAAEYKYELTEIKCYIIWN